MSKFIISNPYQAMQLVQESLFSSDFVVKQYLDSNGSHCFLKNGVLSTEKTAFFRSSAEVLIEGVLCILTFEVQQLFKFEHDINTGFIKIKAKSGQFDHARVVVELDNQDEYLPVFDEIGFVFNQFYKQNAECELPVILKNMLTETLLKVESAMLAKLNRYFVYSVNYQRFKKIEDQIREKVTIEQVEAGWDNYLAMSVDDSASFYISSCLYPEKNGYAE